MRSVATIAALATVLLLSGTVHADKESAERKQRARSFMQDGIAQYDLGRFDEAIKLFERSYELFQFSESLFNLAQSHRQNKNYERAVFFYRAFLRAKPAATNRPLVEDLIVELEQRAKEQKATNEKPPPGVEQPAEDPMASASSGTVLVGTHKQERWYHDGWGIGLTGGGLLGAGTSIAFLVNAASLDDRARAELDETVKIPLQRTASSRRTAGTVAGIIGVAGLVAGIIKLAMPPDSDGKTTTSGLVFGPNIVGYHGSF